MRLKGIVSMHIIKRIINTPWVRSSFVIFSALLILLLLTSCPTPISMENVNQVKDTGAPDITILSPEDGSYYTELVTVDGKITDDTASEGEAGEIRSLSYEIIGPLGTLESSDLTYEEDGSFSFQFASVNIDGSAVVKITAADWNGNIGEKSITLKDPGNEIPSFTVKPGNKEAALSWNSVPGAVGYTVHYTTNGTPPSIDYGKKIENITSAYSAGSPLIIDELENGNMHVFLLQAHSGDPGDLWLSDNEKAIPLSPMTLAPDVTGEYNQIRVEWNPVPATDYFEVLRSGERDGDYINISSSIETTSFIDTAVDNEQVYFYKVKPSFSGSIESDVNSGETSPFSYSDGIEMTGFSYLPGFSSAVAVDGDYAYVGDNFSSFIYVIYIYDPDNPQYVSSIPVAGSGGISDIAVHDGYAYVTSWNGAQGFRVVDLSTGSVVYSFGGTSHGVDLDIGADYAHAYVASYNPPGLYRFDIDNAPAIVPTTPSYYGASLARDVDVEDGAYVYLARFNGYLDVINKSTLTLNRSINLSGIPAVRVSVSGNNACIAAYNYGIRVVDLTTDAIKAYQGYMYAMDVTLIGSFAYVADRYSGLSLINIFPDPPILMDFCDTPGGPYSVAVIGNYAYIADYNAGLSIVDISTSIPSNPVVKNTYPLGDAKDVALSGVYACVANGNSGLQVLVLTDPENPADGGSCDTDGTAKGVAVSGNYAFVADYDYGLQVIKLSDLSGIEGSYDTPGNAEDVAVSGNYAYVADGVAGLQVIDISFTDNPERVGFRYMPELDSEAVAVAVSGNYAYVADVSPTASGLHAVDISMPDNPIIIDTFPCDAVDVAVNGNYAYVADSAAGFLVIDISFPNNLTQVGSCSTSGTPASVALSGNYAFVADGAGGLSVIEITVPNIPTNIAACDLSSNAAGIAVTGNYAFVAAGTNGIKIINLLPSN